VGSVDGVANHMACKLTKDENISSNTYILLQVWQKEINITIPPDHKRHGLSDMHYCTSKLHHLGQMILKGGSDLV
jgi:hypothetical protein